MTARRCIIHIGHAKTATTYLQHCLHLNQALFARHNYWLPSHFHQFGFYDLEPLTRQGKVISGNLAPMHVLLTTGPGDLIATMEQYLFGAPGMPPDCDVLLSCELFFYYWPCTVRMVQAAERFGLAPELVAYLPRQDRAAISAYLQNVRYHDFTEGVVDFLVHDRNIPYCRYMHLLQRMAEKIPAVPITVRTFDPAFLRHGDILQDFLATIHCRVDPASCERPGQNSNQGLLLEQYELMRAAVLLGRPDASARLRTAETSLTAADRARITSFYYRGGLQDFLTRSFLPGNHALLDRFMPNATEAERAYWTTFDPTPPPVALDDVLFSAWRSRAFN